jgi:hypothetical protein
MVARLKSISKQIHWSLLLRAGVFALAWFFLPFWLFFLVALYLYIIPPFQLGRLFWPFFALLVLTWLAPSGELQYAIIFALLFYYLLLIKDLLLIDRRSAYELLILAISFFLARDFFVYNGSSLITATGVWYAFLAAALIGFLVNSFIRCFAGDEPRKPMRRAVAWLSFILTWQMLLVALFLPLDFVYQSVVAFLATVLVIDFIPEHYLELQDSGTGGISRQRILSTGLVIGALFLFVVLSVSWKL